MRVIVHPAAILDLKSATKFYKTQASKELSLALVFEFERTIKLISVNPELGAEWISTARRIVMRRFPFNVVYGTPFGKQKSKIRNIAHLHLFFHFSNF